MFAQALPVPHLSAAKIQNDLRILTERLARINDNLARKITSRNEYDKTIQETEAAYSKIMESSQTLLHVLKRYAPLGKLTLVVMGLVPYWEAQQT